MPRKVKEFNAELQKQYQAADYLDSLHGKKVPQSLVTKVARTTAKVIGAAAGHKLGGGILGGVGGYHIGGVLETAFEGLPNPVKGYFLQNLKTSNPLAFQKLIQYLGEQQAEQLTRLALPPARTIFAPAKSETTIQAEKNTPTNIKILPAQKHPVSVNPKTGKFQTSYSSMPKK